ncbi:ATP-binding cassette domain-containing protein [Streptomyces sp. SID3343]|uniref:ATP-binding cassette domain-containing protein n=1 Tax=Streptomyces sp. SID3343 TaxID=2690260 RepID=UPI00136EBB62|nr:ATP-binding cassette domain-containing protein [Streptomyces sp. SID3343]MYV99994.1 ATP-binding cassette domain-containing protein [Streptomyces sp. SID3343]
MNSPPQTAAISVDELTKRYGRTTVVDRLSFTVREGAVTGFFGPNGAGKTTVLKTIVGLARPNGGRVAFRSGAVPSDARELGVHIEPCGAHPGRTARTHLRALAILAGLPRKRVDEVLETVGLEQAARRRVGTYSMGMRQRLGLATALLGDPEILVLDEPVNGLDPQAIRRLRTLLRERAARGRTTLLSSHMLSEAAQTVDDIVVIDKGRLVHTGTIAELEHSGLSVRTPEPERLSGLIAAAGGRAEPADGGGDALWVEGLPAGKVAELALRANIPLEEITSRTASLEDVFFDLTGGQDA